METETSMTAAVQAVMKNMKAGTFFYGNELKNMVVAIYPDAMDMYPDTIMRMMRRKCRQMYRTVDHNDGLYERVEARA